jgi:hypothetical protein
MTYSYPRLTLDFHTNKRIIDEVVSIFPPSPLVLSHLFPTGRSPLQAPPEQGFWLHYPLDEAYSARARPRYIVQAPGGGARAKG